MNPESRPISGSPWNEIDRVETSLTGEVQRIDEVLIELRNQLLAMDKRINDVLKPKSRKKS